MCPGIYDPQATQTHPSTMLEVIAQFLEVIAQSLEVIAQFDEIPTKPTKFV